MNWEALSVLVTGGTGSFGRMFTEIVLRELRPRKLIVLSRDELRQHEIRQPWEAGMQPQNLPAQSMMEFLRSEQPFGRGL